ncbi:MAG: CxxC-x17-CxxC domain-containing protein [Candidatus Bathyarchaeia archaeon]
MTLVVDDAGSGDLLFGVVVGVYREETGEFKYDIVNVRFYQDKALYAEKAYLQEASRVTLRLVAALQPMLAEEIHVCQGYVFDVAAVELQRVYGEERVKRVRVAGEAQRLVEIAYLDELRNLGYEPLADREEKRAKSFFHMLGWLKANPGMLRYAKTALPRLKRYRLFRQFHQDALFNAVCSVCGGSCAVPFKPAGDKPVYCMTCWRKLARSRRKRRAAKP